jgi:hypothetical protein
LFPKTFRLVEEIVAPEETEERTIEEGPTEKASVEERQTRAKSKEAKKDFMMMMDLLLSRDMRGSAL